MFYMWSQMLFSNDALTANLCWLNPHKEERQHKWQQSDPDPALALTPHQPLQQYRLFLAPGPAEAQWGDDREAAAQRGYLRSDLRDQQPEILAPAPSSRVMSASYDNFLSSSFAQAVGNRRSSSSPPDRATGFDHCVTGPGFPRRYLECSSMGGSEPLRGSPRQRQAAWLV